MRRSLVTLTLLCTASVLLPVLATPAQAASAVRIAKIYWDSPGPDYRSIDSLNDEFIKIRNYGSKSRDLSGWKVKDSDGHTYTFRNFRLDAGESVKLHSGPGSDSAHHLYWDYGNYVWTNTGDKAVLKNDDGNVVDRCRYEASPDPVKDC